MKNVWILVLFASVIPQQSSAGFLGDLIRRVGNFPRPICSRRTSARDAAMSRRSRLVKDALTAGAAMGAVGAVFSYAAQYFGVSDEANQKLSLALGAGLSPLIYECTKNFEVRFGRPTALRRIDEIEELLPRLVRLIEAHKNGSAVITDVEEISNLCSQLILLAAERCFLAGDKTRAIECLHQYKKDVFDPSVAEEYYPDLSIFRDLVMLYAPEQIELYNQMHEQAQQPDAPDAESGSSDDDEGDDGVVASGSEEDE